MSEYDERRGASWGRDSHDRHEPYEWHEPTDRPEPHEDEQEQHAGNGTVNHRPEDQGRHEAGPDHADPAADTAAGFDGNAYGPDAGGLGAGGADGLGAEGLDAGRDRLVAALEALGRSGSGADGRGPDFRAPGAGPDEPGAAPDGFGSDELALRRMLHEAVRDIEPRDGTLEHLRRAVPARRARKRQALVGMAAAALFIGTAIPALVHVSNATGPNADPSIAGQASQAQGGANQGKNPDGGSNGSAGSPGASKDKGTGGQKGQEGKGKDASSGATGGADPTASAPSVPACTAAQLGGATATAGAPDSAGTVYGTFHVTNISATSCTVSDGGSVSAVAQGAADAAKISVVNHAAGDAATGLPDPSQEVTSLVLKPGAAYEVKFAWVPSETCPTTGSGNGGTGGASPDPTPTASPSENSGASTEGSGTSPQLVTEDGVSDGSVAVSHTAATGSTASTTTISNACAGTVYRTGILTAPVS
ncbi:hypothetical protein ACFOZ0_10755 [Streptomyces yaanensis]|uniref:DUF4232 domain-containing protein n=1 Tax=Streptomyces yaanensis TaxID=1142239 RepID=A0ABV7SAY6_9ACTN|nr:hypothetical protein [Streptomyces sp. CGMCC 4.7035]WNB96824.1 hypothetical protein Q2K21_01340 [Streptomyces sp. CGMCC 4.7035]